MPVTVQSRGLDQLITGLKERVTSPGLIVELGANLAEKLEANSPTASGATARALGYLGQPSLTDRGWSIGVGNKEWGGSPNTPAPRGTIAEFLHSLSKGQRTRQVSIQRPDAWWKLPDWMKSQLEAGRREGKWGGQGALFAGYLWNQNYGSAAARLSAKHFIEQSLEEWRAEVPGIVDSYFRA